MFLDLKSVIDYNGNRYELARACMEYSSKVPIINQEEFINANEKAAIVAINDLLQERIQFTREEEQIDEWDDEEEEEEPEKQS